MLLTPLRRKPSSSSSNSSGGITTIHSTSGDRPPSPSRHGTLEYYEYMLQKKVGGSTSLLSTPVIYHLLSIYLIDRSVYYEYMLQKKVGWSGRILLLLTATTLSSDV